MFSRFSTEKIIVAAVVVVCIAVLGFWVFHESKPLPGTQYPDEGRTHIDIGTVMNYGTNPPTSGNHYPQWIKWGIYPAPKDDRNLVHSLEHGYVIMSYNCDINPTGFHLIPEALAQSATDPMSVATDSVQQDASAAATLSDNFKSDQCKQLVDQLTSVYNDKGQVRLIVIPRPNMDSRIALTSWRYLEKLNTFDQKKIDDFIDAHLNQGPEKTIE